MSVVDDIALVAEQERVLVFQRFDEVTALEIGNAIRVLAQAAGANLVIDIRLWNRPLYYYAMPGTGPDKFRVGAPQEQLRPAVQQSVVCVHAVAEA